MPKVIYNGNGSTGQSVPADNTTYGANGSVTAAGSRDLPQGSSLFYWTTKADGRGTPFGPGPSTFPNRSTDVTLANSANAVAASRADRSPVKQTSADAKSTAELLLKILRGDGLSLVTSQSMTFGGIT